MIMSIVGPREATTTATATSASPYSTLKIKKNFIKLTTNQRLRDHSKRSFPTRISYGLGPGASACIKRSSPDMDFTQMAGATKCLLSCCADALDPDRPSPPTPPSHGSCQHGIEPILQVTVVIIITRPRRAALARFDARSGRGRGKPGWAGPRGGHDGVNNCVAANAAWCAAQPPLRRLPRIDLAAVDGADVPGRRVRLGGIP